MWITTMKSNQKFETFNSGIAEICDCDGGKITETIIKIRFQDKTVGMSRFYKAKVADVKIERLISIPLSEVICQDQIVIIGDKQYEIEQIQFRYDTLPKTMLISLSEMAIKKRDVRG